MITSASEKDGQGAASINVGKSQISIQQVKDVIVPVPASKTSIIALEANFEFGKVTNQVDSSSTLNAAHIVVVDVSQGISGNQLELCRVNVPMDAKAVTHAMIDTSHRVAQTVGITLSEKIDSDDEGIAANPKAVNILRKTLLGDAPNGLNTFGQLAKSLGGNKNFAETTNNALSGKMSKQEVAFLDDTGKFQHCLSSGFYKVGIKNIAAVADAPAGFYGYGILEVHNSNGVIAQRYTAHNGQVAVRQSWDNGAKWIGWTAIYSSTTKPNAADVGAYGKGETYSRGEVDSRVNDVRNAANNANNNANGRVPAGRKVNGKPLSADIWLGAGDVGAQPKGNYAIRGECYTKNESDSRYSYQGASLSWVQIYSGRIYTDSEINLPEDIRGRHIYIWFESWGGANVQAYSGVFVPPVDDIKLNLTECWGDSAIIRVYNKGRSIMCLATDGGLQHVFVIK